MGTVHADGARREKPAEGSKIIGPDVNRIQCVPVIDVVSENHSIFFSCSRPAFSIFKSGYNTFKKEGVGVFIKLSVCKQGG